jgi:hypothetical protein
MVELASTGLNLRALLARYERKNLYEKTIANVYISIILERQKIEDNTDFERLLVPIRFQLCKQAQQESRRTYDQKKSMRVGERDR